MTTQVREMVLADIFPRESTDWAVDSFRWRGAMLNGLFTHWCYEYDELPVDETCLEFPCGCERDLADELKNKFGVLVTLPLQTREEPVNVFSVSQLE